MRNMMGQDASWVYSLLSQKFFDICSIHDSYKKNEKNNFCLKCSATICTNCLHLHSSHAILQVRKYVYHDAVNLEDLQKVFDCKHIQAYITNHAKVILLNRRSPTRPVNISKYNSWCHTCNRGIKKPHQFCSLECKVQDLVVHEGSISRYVHNWKLVAIMINTNIGEREETYGRQMTPISVLDGEIMSPDRPSNSCTMGEIESLSVMCTTMSLNIPRKKRTKRVLVQSHVSEASLVRTHRRKGIPTHSPFF
ncbi:hypothetical protein ACHQM5_022961 [Ranunculus cassubicifolius]